MLAQTGSFSQLAEKLKITQPALSKQILSLEKELGIQLFNRNETPIVTTAAGEYFIRTAKELLYKEDQLLRSMEQFKSGERGQLVVGTTPFRSAYLMPAMIKNLRDAFPGVQVKLVEESSEQLKRDASDGSFDFAILNLPANDAALELIPIEPDRLSLVIHDGIAKNFPNIKDKKKISFKECAELPFAVLGTGQEMRVLFERFCTSAGIEPNIAVEVVGLTTAWEMACAGVAATLLPLQFVKSKGDFSNHRLTVIELEEDTYLRRPAVAVKKGQYLSEYAKYAIKLLTEE